MIAGDMSYGQGGFLTVDLLGGCVRNGEAILGKVIVVRQRPEDARCHPDSLVENGGARVALSLPHGGVVDGYSFSTNGTILVPPWAEIEEFV